MCDDAPRPLFVYTCFCCCCKADRSLIKLRTLSEILCYWCPLGFLGGHNLVGLLLLWVLYMDIRSYDMIPRLVKERPFHVPTINSSGGTVLYRVELQHYRYALVCCCKEAWANTGGREIVTADSTQELCAVLIAEPPMFPYVSTFTAALFFMNQFQFFSFSLGGRFRHQDPVFSCTKNQQRHSSHRRSVTLAYYSLLLSYT